MNILARLTDYNYFDEIFKIYFSVYSIINFYTNGCICAAGQYSA